MKLSHSSSRGHAPVRYAEALAIFVITLSLLTVSSCTKKQELSQVPARQGWVSDYADILKSEDKKRLSAELEAFEVETCHQIYLLIIPSLGNDNIAEFSQRAATAWEIGQPGFGNGFLVIIAMQEGTVRIETGSAFEWFIQDGSADKVLKEVMFPLFRQERFVEGIERGLDEIMAAGRLKPIPEDHKPDSCL